jgi:subtilisin family serine protease
MVVAAVDEQGKPTSFTQQDREAFWAPGEKIPIEPRPGKRDAGAGTSYAAALAAGVAARVLTEHPRLELLELLDVLRGTARPIGAGGVPVLNLAAALGKLSAAREDSSGPTHTATPTAPAVGAGSAGSRVTRRQRRPPTDPPAGAPHS